MGISYGPSIVDDSITFHIDAANTKCYDPRENLTVNSQGAFNNTSYWPKVSTTGYTLTDNTTETSAPDGTFTATKINCTTPAQDGSSSFYQDITMPYGLGTYTTSVYIKGSTATRIRIQMFGLWNTIDGFSSIDLNPITGSLFSSFGTVVVEDVGNGWKRYSFTNSANNVNNTVLKFQFYLDQSAGVTYIWGAQIERKSSPGPYVATTTSALVKPLPCNNLSAIPTLESVSNSSRVMYDHRNAGSFTFDGGAILPGYTIDYCGFQLEPGTVASPWDYGSARTTTNCLLDQTKRSTLTLQTDVAYDTDGTPKFAGSALSFIQTNATVVPNGATPYTVSCWVKRNANSGVETFLSSWTAANSSNSFYLSFNGGGGSSFRFSDNWNFGPATGTEAIGTWMNIIAVNEGNNAKVYVNGNLVATKGSALTYTGTGPLVIGRQGEYNVGEFFAGEVDEVQVYTRAFNANDVQKHYNANRGVYGV